MTDNVGDPFCCCTCRHRVAQAQVAFLSGPIAPDSLFGQGFTFSGRSTWPRRLPRMLLRQTLLLLRPLLLRRTLLLLRPLLLRQPLLLHRPSRLRVLRWMPRPPPPPPPPPQFPLRNGAGRRAANSMIATRASFLASPSARDGDDGGRAGCESERDTIIARNGCQGGNIQHHKLRV